MSSLERQRVFGRFEGEPRPGMMVQSSTCGPDIRHVLDALDLQVAEVHLGLPGTEFARGVTHRGTAVAAAAGLVKHHRTVDRRQQTLPVTRATAAPSKVTSR